MKKKEKSLPKEIIIKKDDNNDNQNILNLTSERNFDEINTLNLVSIDANIKKKNNPFNSNGFTEDERIFSGIKSQFANSSFKSIQNFINSMNNNNNENKNDNE